MNGDEGDDQHGLKVHEVHDMQPGLPSSARHHANSTDPAAALALHNTDQQHDTPAKVVRPEPLVTVTAAPAVVGHAPSVLPKALMVSNYEKPEQTEIASSTGNPTNELVIDLCSPIKSKQPSTQSQQHLQVTELQQSPQLQQEPQLQQVPQLQQSQPSQASSLHQGVQSLDLLASDDEFPELRCHFASRSQAGNPTVEVLHDLRPAGVQDHQPDHLSPVVQTSVAHQHPMASTGASDHAAGASKAVRSSSMQAFQDAAPTAARQDGSPILLETPLSASGQTLPPPTVRQPKASGKSSVGKSFHPELQGIEADPKGCEPELQTCESESLGSKPELQGHESVSQGHEAELQGHEPELQGHEAEPQDHEPEHEAELQCHEAELQGHKAELQGREPESQGVHARVKGLLQRRRGKQTQVDNEAGDATQPLTQAEVIEAQTADEEKPMVSLHERCLLSRTTFGGLFDTCRFPVSPVLLSVMSCCFHRFVCFFSSERCVFIIL